MVVTLRIEDNDEGVLGTRNNWSEIDLLIQKVFAVAIPR